MWGENMKKYIHIFLSISLMFILLVACGTKKNKETGFIVDTEKAKLIYTLGEELDLSDLKVYSAYEVGSYKELKEDSYTIDSSLYKKDTPGSYKITVTYKDYKEKYFHVEVRKFTKNPLESMPTADIDISSIFLPFYDEIEYRIDNGEYSIENYFEHLEAGSTHTIYARYKETETHYASEEISKTYTLPLGPASATLSSKNFIGVKNEYLEFTLSLKPNDNINTSSYVSFDITGDEEYTLEYKENETWNTITDNIYKKEGFNLEEKDILFRITTSTQSSFSIYAKIYDVNDDNALLAESNELSIDFILGAAKAYAITHGDAIVNEEYEFEIQVELNDDTFLKNEKVYGMLTYNTSQVPNNSFIVEYYDETNSSWVAINKDFLTEGFYLDNKTYKFRTSVSEEYEAFTISISYYVLGANVERITAQVRFDVLDLSTIKGNALNEVTTLVDINSYDNGVKSSIEEALNTAQTKISSATNSKTIKEAIEEYKNFISSLD